MARLQVTGLQRVTGQQVTEPRVTGRQVPDYNKWPDYTHLDMSEDQWPVCNQDGRNRRLCQSRPVNSHGHTPDPQIPCTRRQLQHITVGSLTGSCFVSRRKAWKKSIKPQNCTLLFNCKVSFFFLFFFSFFLFSFFFSFSRIPSVLKIKKRRRKDTVKLKVYLLLLLI